MGKESVCDAGDLGFEPWVGKIPWRRAWQPTPVFSPGEAHGQRGLVGYRPQGCKELDMTKVTTQAHTVCAMGAPYTRYCHQERMNNYVQSNCLLTTTLTEDQRGKILSILTGYVGIFAVF